MEDRRELHREARNTADEVAGLRGDMRTFRTIFVALGSFLGLVAPFGAVILGYWLNNKTGHP